MAEITVQVGLSKAFLNKDLRPGYSEAAYGNSFVPTAIALAELVEHCLSGNAFTPGYFKGKTRTNATFISMQVFAVDVESADRDISVRDALAVPFVRDYTFLIMPSPSSGRVTKKNPGGYKRLRILFWVSEPVEGVERARALARAICALVELPVDPASFKPAQPSFGSTNHVEAPYIHLDVSPVDLAWASGALWDEAWEEMLRAQAPRRRTAPPDSQTATNTARARLERALSAIASATPGSRHETLIKKACYVFGLQLGGWPVGDVLHDLRAAAAQCGLPECESEDILTWAQQHATAVPFEVPVGKQKRKGDRPSHEQTVNTGYRPDDTAVPVRYVSDDLTPDQIRALPTLLIQGPTGIGKTSAIAKDINTRTGNPRVTGVAQFRLLTVALSRAFDHAHHYEDATGPWQRGLGAVDRLVTSVSSLHKFNRRGGVAVVDELEGVLQFLSESDTFKRAQALAAWQALKKLVQSADQLIGMDANLSEIAIDYIQALRGPATIKRYRAAHPRGKVVLLDSPTAGLRMIEKLLGHERGQVIVACSSEADASEVADWFSTVTVLKITADTSNTLEVRAAILNQNGERSAYKLIVYTSAAGAGVDISEPVYALVGLFHQHPLAPEQAIQLFGRVRHARRLYAVVPPRSPGYATPTAADLLADRLVRERWTARKTGMTPQDKGDYLELVELWAKFQARKRRETAQWWEYFARRLQANGYSFSVSHARASAAFRKQVTTWRSRRKDRHWAFVRDALGRALPDEDLDALRMSGEPITTDLKLRNTRFKIERTLEKADVTEQDRDLMSPRGRTRLAHLRDLFGQEDDLLAVDRAEASEGRPLQKRSYSTLMRTTLSALLSLAGYSGTPEAQVLALIDDFREVRSAESLTQRYSILLSAEAMRKFEALGHHGNNSRTVTGLCRWLFKYLGFSLESEQRRDQTSPTDRPMFYWLDPEAVSYCLERARHAAQARRNRSSENVYKTPNSTFSDTPPVPDPPPNPPAPSGEGYTSAEGAAHLEEMLEALGARRRKAPQP